MNQFKPVSTCILSNLRYFSSNLKIIVVIAFISILTLSFNVSAASLDQSGGSVTLYGNVSYDFVNLTNGAILYVASYNGTAGTGTLNLTVNYTINVSSDSSINANARGLTGGVADTDGGNGGMITGNGGGSDGTMGGGNGHGGGGGGGYGTAGGGGGNGWAGTGGSGGIIKGTYSGTDIDMGSGAGAGGAAKTCGACGVGPGESGQQGGGLINISALTMIISGTITANGGNGGAGANGIGTSSGGGAGGGGASGGGIKLNATTLNLNGATITATGGSGGAGGSGDYSGSPGAAGGAGRIKIWYATITNTSSTVNTGSSGTVYYNRTLPVSLTLVYPFNNTNVTNYEKLNWTEWPLNSLYTYQIATDSGFTNIVSSGSECTIEYEINISTCYLTLSTNTQYFWRIKNATGDYTLWRTFNTTATSTIPGRLNITAVNESNWGQPINIFTAIVYNSTYYISRSTTTGWANFSSAELSNSSYFVTVIPNSTYASRSKLLSSPMNSTFVLPPQNYIVDTVSFYLYDYSGSLPWQSTIFSLIINNTIVHSSYFDADAKVSANLIRGQSYIIRLTNGNTIQEWGNYISTANGSVQIAATSTTWIPTNTLVYNLTWTNTTIDLEWNGTVSSLSYQIYKGVNVTNVHALNTSLSIGTSSYIVSNTSDYYLVRVNAYSGIFWDNRSFYIDFRSGAERRNDTTLMGDIGNMSYNGYTLPINIQSLFAVFLIILLGASFGALYAPLGAMITAGTTLLFSPFFWGWLDISSTLSTFFVGIFVMSIIYYIQHKDSGG